MKCRPLIFLWLSIALALGSMLVLHKSITVWSALVQDSSGSEVTSDWQNMGIYGGDCGGLAWNPTNYLALDPVGDILYYCTSGVYGVYKSIDGGAWWDPITNTLGGSTSLSFDQENGYLFMGKWGSIYRSDDGGLNWLEVLNPTDAGVYNLFRVIVDPVTPTDVYAFSVDGALIKSADSGETWQRSMLSPDGSTWLDNLNNPFHSLSVDPTNLQTIYAAVGRDVLWAEHGGIYRSTDGGLNFQRIITDTQGSVSVGVNSRGTIFASYENGIWRSRDHAETWERVLDYMSGLFSFHPTLPDKVWTYAHQSDDEGDTWTFTGYVSPPIVHPVFTDTLYALNPIGPIKSTDGGSTWLSSVQGIEEMVVQKIEMDPHDYQRLFLIANYSVGYTQDDGATWDFPTGNPILVDKCCDFVIDPLDPMVAYVGNVNWIWKSTDGGQNWTSSADIETKYPGEIVPYRILINPENTQNAYLAMGTGDLYDSPPWGGVYKSFDGTATWESTGLTDIPVREVIYITQTQTLFAGTVNTTDDPLSGGVYCSVDFGETWEHVGLEGIAVNDMVVDPRNANHIYVGTRGPDADGIYKSYDGGQTWQRIFYLGPDQNEGWGIAIDPENPDIVYALMQGDIYRSQDAGQIWYLFHETRYELGEGAPQFIFVVWLPPAPVPDLSAQIINGIDVRLEWTAPADSDFAGTMVRVMTDTFPAHYYQGELVTDLPGEPAQVITYTHNGGFNGEPLFYALFAYDDDGYCSNPAYVMVSSQGILSVMEPAAGSGITQNSRLYLANTRGLYRIPIEDFVIEVFLPIVARVK